MGANLLKARKKTNLTKHKRKKNTLISIPAELIADIVARLAACSCKDFFNIKLSCKTLSKITDDKYVIQCVSLDEFPVIISWPLEHRQAIFLNNCLNSGNSGAIYRHGIEYYFKKRDRESGMEFLWRAANLGHLEAKYMIGMILILLGGESKQKGVKIIGDMKKSKVTRHRIREIREKFVSILDSYSWSTWLTRSMGEQIRPTCCTRHANANLINYRVWDGYEDYDLECEACCCDQETIHVWEDVTNPNYMIQLLVG